MDENLIRKKRAFYNKTWRDKNVEKRREYMREYMRRYRQEAKEFAERKKRVSGEPGSAE